MHQKHAKAFEAEKITAFSLEDFVIRSPASKINGYFNSSIYTCNHRKFIYIVLQFQNI